jgi:excisionase family DNA binding protein
MEPRFLTVAEAARYLRLNPRSVYLLAQRGGIPASRLTGKWLFPVHLLDEWIESSARGRTGAGDPPSAARGTLLPTANLLLAGSDDPALELLADALRDQAEKPVLFTATLGRGGGLAALREGRADVAVCAHAAPASGEPDLADIARALPGRALVVVTVFGRELGLVVWTGNPRKLEGVRDLGRRGVRFVNRQPGSATRAFT